jgi:16S rRNA (guanine966-N2)-methyltransferase
VREALFARLGELEGLRVLDLYAGSGALGIEAISRGATSALFVERDARVLAVLQQNLASLGLDRAARVVAGDVSAVLQRLGREGVRADLALIDPPYASGESARAFEALVGSGILCAGAMVVLERGRRDASPQVSGLTALDERRYGDTVVARVSAQGIDAAGEP